MLRRMPPDWHRQYRVGRATLARNGGPVLPDAPTPEQAMLIIANTAGGNFDTDKPTGDQPVPKAVRDAAMKGLRLSYKNNYGGWEFFGIARAIQLALVPKVPLRTRERMVRYLEAHEKDKAGSNFGNDAKPSRGYMAWLNWGGDPAVAWNERDGISRATYGASARRTNGVKTTAVEAAAKIGAKVGIKGGGKFLPVVGEALMAYDVTQEGRRLYRERRSGKTHSLRETGARLAGSALVGSEGVEWAQKKLEARKAKKNPVRLSPGPFGGTDLNTTSSDGYAEVFVGSGKQTSQLLRAAYSKYPEAARRVAKHKAGKVAWLDYIEAREKGKGSGGRVLVETLTALDADGVEAVYLHTASGVLQDARTRFFERYGFVLLPDDADRPRRLMVRSAKKNPRYTSAVRTDPELWEEIKAEVTRGARGGLPGQWSARKAQMAVALYQDRGGGYVGPKSPRNALAKWTREQWRTKSGRPSLETGERYLPAAAIAALTPAEYAATSRVKRAGMRKGEQFVPQPERIAEKVKRYRRNPLSDEQLLRVACVGMCGEFAAALQREFGYPLGAFYEVGPDGWEEGDYTLVHAFAYHPSGKLVDSKGVRSRTSMKRELLTMGGGKVEEHPTSVADLSDLSMEGLDEEVVEASRDYLRRNRKVFV